MSARDTVRNRARSEARIRLAYALQTAHGIDMAEMAEVLGFAPDSYLARLRRLQLDGSSGPMRVKRRETDPALERLQLELKRLLDAEELPDKGKAEALMALARAVKTVGELAAGAGAATVPDRQDADSPASVAEARQALIRIDRRIEELAKKRAREILGGGLDAKATDGGGGGVASPGA